ncbi:MAG TPA: 5-formyltetrahydrofolate cyclo-ligase [Nocardioidaceae bacterium]|nr:5-formyltetrahydrofolate cyclo-ligase [Nocardioidaceae bacterium]
MDDALAAQKLARRDQLTTVRRRRSLLEVGDSAQAIADHLLATAIMQRAATIAAYISIGGEPGTGPLIDAWFEAGRRTILPVLRPDNDLDWAVYRGPTSLAPARRGLLEPVGEPLGLDAIATADVVLTPGLAVDSTGMRLGRGGGSYDRALGRVPVGTPVLTLLYDGELVDEVPSGDHDRRVSGVVTPSGITWF